MPDDHEYADALTHGLARGRGAQLNPGNRYEAVRLHVLGEHLDRLDGQPVQVPTQVFEDRTKTVINPVNSPDVPFSWSINPYRGCEHGCAYCYARPDHERLGFSCGLDFETKIIAKPEAAKLLRGELAQATWRGEVIAMSGVTDCYQPLERTMKITRSLLEVMAQCRQPVVIVTKNKLVLRDLDLLTELAKFNAAKVSLSVTTLDHDLAARLEPRASAPRDRLDAIAQLRAAGVPVTVMVAPIIPGLTDKETPAILEAAANAGASAAGYVMLRLPHQLKALFTDWLQKNVPLRAAHVENLIRQTHQGELYDCDFGVRKRGTGPVAQQVRDLFNVFAKRYRLHEAPPPLSSEHFRRPAPHGQLSLFGNLDPSMDR